MGGAARQTHPHESTQGRDPTAHTCFELWRGPHASAAAEEPTVHCTKTGASYSSPKKKEGNRRKPKLSGGYEGPLQHVVQRAMRVGQLNEKVVVGLVASVERKNKPGGVAAGFLYLLAPYPPHGQAQKRGPLNLPTSTPNAQSVTVKSLPTLLRSLQGRVSAPFAVLVHGLFLD